MDKTSNFDDENGALHNVESFVLDRLSSEYNSRGGTSISIGELTKSIDTTMSLLLDQAIKDLIAQSLIHSPDGEHYRITPDGINELENRRRESIPL